MATLVSFDRDRAFCPILLVLIASYYVLFAVMGGDGHAVVAETLVVAGFLMVAAIGFKKNLWLVVAGLAFHGIFDWAFLFWLLQRSHPTAPPHTAP